MMDTRNTILWVSFIFVCFLLWEAWQQDYGVQPQAQVGTAQQTTQWSSGAELPQVTLEPTVVQESASSAGLEPIQVETDVLSVQINPQGGDITKASLIAYPIALGAVDSPYVLLNTNPESLYIAQSGLISELGPDTFQGHRHVFSSSQQKYVLEDQTNTLNVMLTWTSTHGVTVNKIFEFKRGSYLVNVYYHIENQSGEPWSGKFYGQLKRKNAPKSGNQFGAYSYFGGAYSTQEEPYEKIAFDDMASQDLNVESQGGWVSMLEHYFVSAWIPNQEEDVRFYSKSLGNQAFRLGFTGATMRVEPGQSAQIDAALYVGPKLHEQLEGAAPNLDLTIDYGWLWFISAPLFWLLKWFYELIGNWGWAIVMVTLCVKLAFFQLSATSYRSMANMRRIQPKLVSLKERYGDDRQKMSQAMMELYKKEKINPLGGCLPILVQIPVFIALYWVLLESVELRQADFIFWIKDLSAKDPYYVLPLLMGVTMFLQQMLNPAPMDPMHAKMMKILPIVFTFFFMFFQSGLVLYWLVSNILSIAQQYIITRVIVKTPNGGAAPESSKS